MKNAVVFTAIIIAAGLGLSIYSGEASISIAGAALGLSVWQAQTSMRHNKLSVKPSLAVQSMIEDGHVIAGIKNVGLGPARITSFRALANNSEFQNNEDGWNGALANLDPNINWQLTRLSPGKTVLTAGQFEPILHTDSSPLSDEDSSRVFELLKRINIVVGYESFYEEPQPALDSSLRPSAN